MLLAGCPLAAGAAQAAARREAQQPRAQALASAPSAAADGRQPPPRIVLLGPRRRPARLRATLRPLAASSRPSAAAASSQVARPQNALLSSAWWALTLQAALVVALALAALAWFTASSASPYSSLPEVVFVRKLTVSTFWKARRLPWVLEAALLHPGVADGMYNPLHYTAVALTNAALFAWSLLLPVLQTLPEATLLAVTELGALVLDVTLILAAAAKAVLLKAVYWGVFVLDVLLQSVSMLFADVDGWLKSLIDWLLSKDPLGLLLSLLLARPFTGLAHLLLGTTKLAVQWSMAAVETACAVLYAAPAGLGVVLLPLLYVAAAVWRRARRVVVSEPPLAFTLDELEQRVSRLQPLRVPALPIEEKRLENEYVGFVNAVGTTLQPLRVPPLDVDALTAANAADGVNAVTRAQAVDATMERTPLQASYSVVSNTEVTMNRPPAGYDGLEAVREQMDSLQRTVANLPPLADAKLAEQAREQARAAAIALAQAEAALAEAEAAFYAVDSTVTATTTTTTVLRDTDDASKTMRVGVSSAKPQGVPPGASETVRITRVQGNGPDRTSDVKDALIRGLAAGIRVATDVEASGTQQVRRRDE